VLPLCFFSFMKTPAPRALVVLALQMTNPPSYILLENVKGFELSDTFGVLQEVRSSSQCWPVPISTVIGLTNTLWFLCQTLRERDYAVQNFILTPQQFGIPNARVRFYCLVRGTHQTAALRCALPHGRSIQLATPTTNQATLRSSTVSAGPDQAHHIMETIPSTAAGGGTHARTIADYLTPLEDGGDDQYLVPPSFLKSLTRGYRFGTRLPSGKASFVLIVDLCVPPQTL
jgi:site-specific DNA-cytosine methylase